MPVLLLMQVLLLTQVLITPDRLTNVTQNMLIESDEYQSGPQVRFVSRCFLWLAIAAHNPTSPRVGVRISDGYLPQVAWHFILLPIPKRLSAIDAAVMRGLLLLLLLLRTFG